MNEMLSKIVSPIVDIICILFIFYFATFISLLLAKVHVSMLLAKLHVTLLAVEFLCCYIFLSWLSQLRSVTLLMVQISFFRGKASEKIYAIKRSVR